MKRIIWLIFMCCMVANAKAMDVTTSIKGVTVYVQGATVQRVGKTRVPSGKSVLSFTSLPNTIDKESIRITKKGNLKIEQIAYSQIDGITIPDDILTKKGDTEIALEQGIDKVELLKEELTVLKNFINGSANKGLGVQEIKEMRSYFTMSEIEILNKISLQEKTINKRLRKVLDSLEEEIRLFKSNIEKRNSRIDITIIAEKETDADLFLEYNVFGAGWNPYYDVHKSTTVDKLSFILKANVWQNTHEDWNNVPITLSSAYPESKNIYRELSPYVLDFSLPYMMSGRFDKSYVSSPRLYSAPILHEANSVAEDEEIDLTTPEIENSSLVNNDRLKKGAKIEFSIQQPITINSGDQSMSMDLDTASLPAIFRYRCAPKNNSSASLIAGIADWQNAIPIDGEASLYVDGSLVGKANLNGSSTVDTLLLSFGTDNRIYINRQPVSKGSKRSTQKDRIIQTKQWTITVSQQLDQEIPITIYDQIPITSQSEISIKPFGVDGKLNESTGIVEWDMLLKPKEKKVLNIGYEVSYPKKKRLNIE